MEMKQDIIETILEPLVDKYGLGHVVAGLALLAHEKAAHIESAWQDEVLAKCWTRDGAKLEKVAAKLEQ